MEIIRVLTVLRQRWPWVLLGVVVAAAVWTFASFKVSLAPPRLQEEKGLEYGSAVTQVLVDSTVSPLGNLEATFDPLMTRAGVYARLVGSPELLEYIARESGVPASQIWAEGPFNPYASKANREPTAERRAAQLAGEKKVSRLRMEAESGIPIINVNVMGPTADGARRLADGAAAGLKRYIDDLQKRNEAARPSGRAQLRRLKKRQARLERSANRLRRRGGAADAAAQAELRRLGAARDDVERSIEMLRLQSAGTRPEAWVNIRQLGKAQGTLVNEGVDRQIGFMLAGAVFVGWLLLIVFVSNTIEDYRLSRRMQLAGVFAVNGSGSGPHRVPELSDELTTAP